MVFRNSPLTSRIVDYVTVSGLFCSVRSGSLTPAIVTALQRQGRAIFRLSPVVGGNHLTVAIVHRKCANGV